VFEDFEAGGVHHKDNLFGQVTRLD
jgi:hypothetical protein